MPDEGIDVSVNEDRCLHVALSLWHAALSVQRKDGYEGKGPSNAPYSASNAPERQDTDLVVERKAQYDLRC